MPENKNFKSVAELRGDDVRSAAEKLKQVRKKLTGWNVPDTVHWNQLVDINVDEKNIKINCPKPGSTRLEGAVSLLLGIN